MLCTLDYIRIMISSAHYILVPTHSLNTTHHPLPYPPHPPNGTGSPSLPAKQQHQLASHRSLFDLLTLDYTTQMQSDGSGGTNILHTNTINTNTTNTTNNTTPANVKHRHGFNPHAIHTPELGALQYHRESSYHKITLPDVTEEGEDLSGM